MGRRRAGHSALLMSRDRWRPGKHMQPTREPTREPGREEDEIVRLRSFPSRLDHTNLRQDATEADIEMLCKEAIENRFYAVCVNPCYAALARDLLFAGTVKLCVVAGFPLGANTAVTKLLETKQALQLGADEIDVVMNVGFFKSGKTAEVAKELAQVVGEIKLASPDKICKVIIETALLSRPEIHLACRIVDESGADFVKTSTGFCQAGGATVEALEEIHRHRGRLKVKAAGGIRDLETALAMLRAGADRLGVSQSVSILSELRKRYPELQITGGQEGG
jgi:deoxyribose-phosphate aldolase